MAGFLTLGVIILLWVVVWHVVFRAWSAQHPDSPFAQAIATVI